MRCGIDFVDPQHRFDKAKECALVQMICNTLLETRMEEAMRKNLKIGLAKIDSLTVFLPGMVWLSQMTSSPYLCTAIMSLAYSFNGAIYAGHSLNSLTIATNRLGLFMAYDL